MDKTTGLRYADDIDVTARTYEAAKIAGVDVKTPRKKTPRFTAKDLTDEEAAIHIQGIWRARKAQRLMHKMIAEVYEKKFDPESKSFFYFNKKTQKSHWTKPPGLRYADDIDVTARTYEAAKIAGVDVKTPRKENTSLYCERFDRRRSCNTYTRYMAGT